MGLGEVSGRGLGENGGARARKSRGLKSQQEAEMSQKVYALVSGVVFLVIALGHLVRVILGASFIVEGYAVPQWASGAAVVLMGYLAFEGLRLWRGSRAG